MASEETESERALGFDPDHEAQPRDEVLADGESPVGNTNEFQQGNALVNPYMPEEEQNVEMAPQVVGPPAYASPDPATAGNRLLPLTEHPAASEGAPEEMAISEDYGATVEGATVTPSEGTHSGEPASVAAAEGGAESDEGYESMTKAELQEQADERGVETNSNMTKADLIAALQEDDNSTSES